MATDLRTNQNALFTNGSVDIRENIAAAGPAGADEESRTRDLARRYHCEFFDLRNFHLDTGLLRKVPVELMFR